jgi:hypothetical protein
MIVPPVVLSTLHCAGWLTVMSTYRRAMPSSGGQDISATDRMQVAISVPAVGAVTVHLPVPGQPPESCCPKGSIKLNIM